MLQLPNYNSHTYNRQMNDAIMNQIEPNIRKNELTIFNVKKNVTSLIKNINILSETINTLQLKVDLLLKNEKEI